MKRISNLYDYEELDTVHSVYDLENVSLMLENDEIDSYEEAFMRGYLAA
tara:strand:- start:3165 stop:3311 length:147 start_codon:yes stop_codon:yes gene_type:complete